LTSLGFPSSARHFPGHCFGLISASGQLRGFCFPGSALNSIWVPFHKAAARIGSRSHSPVGGPKKMGHEKEENSVMAYLNSITLVGFVGSDPKQRQAKGNGSKFTVLSIATQRSWKNAEDEWVSKTKTLRTSAGGLPKTSERASKGYLGKGTQTPSPSPDPNPC
jgi:hypothetical protein